jgi:2-amino-4-hydroxy-6-hydroxymethyldihydropteridine diphosphokinase
MHDHTVYIGLGSNIGDKYQNIALAIDKMRLLPSTLVVEQSSNYLTAPVGSKDQPDFLNAAVKITTDLAPRELLDRLKAIEKALGRVETTRWGPRVIDLDILLYDNIVMDEETLKIPHPLMHNREFALEPLGEIAPEAYHPVLKKTVREMLQELRIAWKSGDQGT